MHMRIFLDLYKRHLPYYSYVADIGTYELAIFILCECFCQGIVWSMQGITKCYFILYMLEQHLTDMIPHAQKAADVYALPLLVCE